MTPKRKRAVSALPQLDTIIADSIQESDPESPRTQVAENLCQLQIRDQRTRSISPPEPQAQCQASKRRHLPGSGTHTVDIHRRACHAGQDAAMDKARTMVTPPKDLSPTASMGGILGIGETPGAYSTFNNRLPSSPPISPTPSPSKTSPEHEKDIQMALSDAAHAVIQPGRDAQKDGEYRSESRTSAGRQARRKSKCAPTPVTAPPPPTPITSPGEEAITQSPLATAAANILNLPPLSAPEYMESTSSPAKKRRSSPPPAPTISLLLPTPSTTNTDCTDTSMTWHDSEITGHLWNPDTDADDDGEGINGIGFRPTAATEWKRKENRKRQVTEWRAREAKEERRRRLERRKRDTSGESRASLANLVNSVSDDVPERNQAGKRVRVRFAETA
ncbi:hypothetical protein BDV97DRAFT_397089 [Delphinella strobiligena]|nr:hypothetical protein BDV97DRAFT_397089 [Delphinella strobiligena]